jgi:hypothetical protein
MGGDQMNKRLVAKVLAVMASAPTAMQSSRSAHPMSGCVRFASAQPFSLLMDAPRRWMLAPVPPSRMTT